MKKQVLMACLAVVAGASASTATYSFSWYRNAAWIKATYDNLKPGVHVRDGGNHAISRHHIDLPIGERKDQKNILA